VRDLLVEVADAGCLSLLISGGEPLLRRDFVDIYTAAVRLGMLVTVFTNATLVDQRIVTSFVEYPPRQVEISVYGATEATYERITGVRGSFARAIRGIRGLLDAGVRVGLKTMILRDNAHEIEAIEAWAEELGVRFRLDSLVTPRLDGNPAPLEQRVDPGTAVALELGNQKRLSDLISFRDRQSPIPETSSLYGCYAGLTLFHVDPTGVVHPCLMSQEIGLDALGLGFEAAWHSLVAAMGRLQRREDSECAACNLKVLCGYCPGLFALESGSPHVHSEYLCRLGSERLGIIEETCEVRG
jgi:radical SAM protein with 4Fe4S-binding SPASM domain